MGSRTFGGSDKILIPASSLTDVWPGDFSAAVWFDPTTLPAYCALLDTPGRLLTILLNSSGSPNLVYTGIAGIQQEIGLLASVTTGSWQHLMLTRAGSTCKYYLNGSLASTFTNGATSTSQEAIAVGNNTSGGGSSWNGSIGEPCIWNSALSSTDATNLYGGGTAGALPSTISPGTIVGYWPLRGVQSPEPDISTSNGINGGTANSNDGVLTGTTVGSKPPVVYQTSPVTYTASGVTFFLPQTTSVQFFGIGAGQAGFNGGGTGGAGGAGGDSGLKVVTGLTVDQAYTVNVGGGGPATGAGVAGGDSWFDTTGTAQAIGGGSVNSDVLDTTYAGGMAGAGGTANGGGGGGSSGGTSSAGNAGSAGVLNVGGAGGAAVTGGGAGGAGGDLSSNGVSGSSPGGGGGGGGALASALTTGGDGKVILSWPVGGNPPVAHSVLLQQAVMNAATY